MRNLAKSNWEKNNGFEGLDLAGQPTILRLQFYVLVILNFPHTLSLLQTCVLAIPSDCTMSHPFISQLRYAPGSLSDILSMV